MLHESENPALARGASGIDLLGGSVISENKRTQAAEQEWPADPDDDARREHLLHALRSASLRMAASKADLDSVGVALKGGLISVEFALDWLDELQAMPLVEHFLEAR